MSTAQLSFVVERCGGATGSDVSRVTGTGPVRKYAMRMRNQKLWNIRPGGGLLTGSDVTSGRGPVPKYVLCMPGFSPRFFSYYSSTIFDRKWRQTNVSGRGTVRKYVLRMPGFSPPFFLSSSISTMATEGHVTPTSPEEFSHNASLYVIINYPDRWRYYLVTW